MRIVTLIGLILFCAWFSGCARIGAKLESHIERVGTTLTETPVSVEKVSIRPARGIGEIRGFRVANPDGYKSSEALSCERIYLNIGLLSTIAGEPLVVDRLIISYPLLTLEINEDGQSNLQEIRERVERNMKQADQASAEIKPASEETPQEPLRIRIGELVIEGVTLQVLRADGSSDSAILPAISLQDVGTNEGVTPGQLGLVVAGAITGEMLKEAIARQVINKAGDIKQALEVENLLTILVQTLHLGPEVQQRIRPVVEELSEGLGNMIDAWVEQGYIDLKEISRQLIPVVERFRAGVSEILDANQLKLVDERLAEFQNNGVELLRYLAINQIAAKLQITPEQLIQLRPIMHEHIARISLVIEEVAANPQRNREMLIEAYGEAAKILRNRLAPLLTEDQKEMVDSWLDQILEKILLLSQRYL